MTMARTRALPIGALAIAQGKAVGSGWPSTQASDTKP